MALAVIASKAVELIMLYWSNLINQEMNKGSGLMLLPCSCTHKSRSTAQLGKMLTFVLCSSRHSLISFLLSHPQRQQQLPSSPTPFFAIMLESIPGWVFITGVSLLIATIAYSSQLFILLPAMEWWSPTAAKLLIPFNLLVLMVYYNYYLACTTDPGRVPSGWVSTIDSTIVYYIMRLIGPSFLQEPPYSTFQNDDSTRWQRQELPATDTGMTGPRYCKQCKHYKPPRAHHCRYCRRCVLKMDHHCPWIANCVGYDNYGHFVRFVLYVDIACGYALGLLGWRVSMILDDIRHFRVRNGKGY